jgi:hypothetical protein
MTSGPSGGSASSAVLVSLAAASPTGRSSAAEPRSRWYATISRPGVGGIWSLLGGSAADVIKGDVRTSAAVESMLVEAYDGWFGR